jgi:hypothetical protein
MVGKFKRGFEKAFKEAVPNFNGAIAHFVHGRSLNDECSIAFICDGVIKSLPLYYYQGDINVWKTHFIEVFETGNFDYNQYWVPYGGSKPIEQEHLVPRKLPLCVKYGNDFYTDSPEVHEFGREMRDIYPGCGYKYVGK